MVKRLCKWSRHEISAGLGDLHRLVSAPKFVCGACARSANQSSSLCKPLALTSVPVKRGKFDSPEKPLLKLSKKQLKQQKKHNKKLKKLIAKQTKLVKKLSP